MSKLERILRFSVLPICICLAIVAIYWVWETYPKNETFFLTRILPFYSLYLTLTAVCYKVLSGEIKQFMVITTFISSLFVVEIFCRVLLDIKLF